LGGDFELRRELQKERQIDLYSIGSLRFPPEKRASHVSGSEWLGIIEPKKS
jgi:hypothetical protein